MRSWASPMFDRKDGKKDALLSLEDRAERLDRFYSLIRSSGEKIHFLLRVGKKKKEDFLMVVLHVRQALSFTHISSFCEVIMQSAVPDLL